jgi:hypothetical protein
MLAANGSGEGRGPLVPADSADRLGRCARVQALSREPWRETTMQPAPASVIKEHGQQIAAEAECGTGRW